MPIKNARISALLPQSLVFELKKISAHNKITQSQVVKNALELWFQKNLDKDTKELAKINFDDLPSEDDWLKIQA